MTDELREAELLPCPFCGARNRGDILDIYPSSPSLGRNHWAVRCDDCGSEGPTISNYNSDNADSLCEKAWNARASMQPEIDRRVAEEKAKLLAGLRTPSEGMLEAGGHCEGVILDDFDGVVVFPRRIWLAMLAQFEKENSDG